MKISIIIPIYNGEKFIKKCLNSILNQTYKNWEAIIVNDGSTDNTELILKEYCEKDSRILSFNKKNSGVSDSRNIGIEKAVGDYITFVDCDDWIEKDTLEKIVAILQEKECEVLRYNHFINYSNNTERVNIYDKEIIGKTLEKEQIKKYILPRILSGSMPAYVWLLFIKKDIIKKQEKFNTNLSMMEDTIFYLNLLININTMYIFNECLYHYYYSLESSSHSSSKVIRNFNDLLLVNKIEEKLIIDNNLDIESNKKLYNTAHAKMIEDMCFKIFKNTTLKETKEKIKEIVYNKDTKNILLYANLDNIPIHKKISLKLIKKEKVNLLLKYYKFRKIFYHLKNKLTKRVID